TYLRLSVTDRCNLRCRYCLPEKNVHFLPGNEILNWEELHRLTTIFAQLGVIKLRVTGGEPFLRKGILNFLYEASRLSFSKGIFLTTNGVETLPFLENLKVFEIAGINLSLDTLQRDRFKSITRRDLLPKVMETFYQTLFLGIPLKINTVVKAGLNTDEIESLARLAEDNPVEVRFIEEMPQLSGNNQKENGWQFNRILSELQSFFPNIIPLPANGSTAGKFKIPGFTGQLGIIAGHSRLFCSTCNRVRVTATGLMKTCLYDNGVLDLKQLLRTGAADSEIQNAIREKVSMRMFDGFSAYATRGGVMKQSMAAIGG
ncbi:MAG TPA: GTP 3',8-cyclase MoaA, partial [Bacteroidetes bacterium]|nr:GTP 3',8-cyclase MoaA [Bacteroidota bacterium]